MILFYEGLPRSGKSLNALKEYIVPMLKKGRQVYAYIEGLNHEQIAKLAGIEYDKCIDLLIPLNREDVLNWFKIVPNDSFIVLDEIQNFYPSARKELDPEVIQAIAEHGHKGLDILLMGQVFSDVHKTWLGRCAQRVLFMKREAAGKPNEFSQIIYKPVVAGDKIKWQELRRIKGLPYDKNYFGAYKSHTEGTDNTDTLIDDRANVWNTPAMKRWLPLFAIVVITSIIYLIYMFMGGGLEKSLTNQKPKMTQENIDAKLKHLNQVPLNQINTQTDLNQPINKINYTNQPIKSNNINSSNENTNDTFNDEIINLNKLGRIRFSGYIKMGKKISGWIEWRADEFRVIERLTFDELKVFGYLVLVDPDGRIASITNGINRFTASSWPIAEPRGQITNERNQLIQSQPLNNAATL